MKEKRPTNRKNFFKRLKNSLQYGHKKNLESRKSLNLTNVIWIFVLGSFIGFLIETAFLFINSGYIESRQGLVYGPFSQIYGMGAIILAFLLLPLKERGKGWLFIGSGILGGVFEASASFIQEKIFGTVSWHYEILPALGGRTSIIYMMYWSILGYAYIMYIYPKVIVGIEKVPKQILKVMTVCIVIFMTVNIGMSAMAVARWSGRVNGKEAKNEAEVWIDTHFDNNRMGEIYPNMLFSGIDNEKIEE